MISRLFIERPRFALVIAIVLSMAGAMALTTLPVEQYPQVAPPSVRVSASYPGASAEVLAKTVASPIEQAVNGVDDMIYMESTSDNQGNYNLTVTFAVGTDLDMAQVKVQNRVQKAKSKLPTEVTQQGIDVESRSPSVLGFHGILFAGQQPRRAVFEQLRARADQGPAEEGGPAWAAWTCSAASTACASG